VYYGKLLLESDEQFLEQLRVKRFAHIKGDHAKL